MRRQPVLNACSMKYGQSGLTIVEVMIALTLSLILIAGVVQLFVSTSQSARMQENGRTGITLLTRAIRSADYWGCASSRTRVTNNLNPSGSGYNGDLLGFANGLDGQDNVTGDPNVLAGTDKIILRGVGGDGNISITHAMNNSSAHIEVNTGNGLAQGQVVFLSDCIAGDVFQITNANPDGSGSVNHNTGNVVSPGNYNPNTCNSGHCLSRTYDVGAKIYIPFVQTYFLKNNTAGEPALFRTALNSQDAAATPAPTELVEGIENMQILYGEDTNDDGSADIYRVASAVTDMNNVKSIRVDLTVRSIETNVADSGDGRLRRTYTTTIAIRNRM